MEEDQNITQGSLDDLENWNNGNRMIFNITECMHLGINGAHEFKMAKENDELQARCRHAKSKSKPGCT